MTAVERSARLPVGVVVERRPGVTRWAKWAWKATAVLPGAGPGNWKELSTEGDVVSFHAATADLELHRAETEAYLVALNAAVPTVWVILRPPPTVTASAYQAQDFADNGEDLVEPVPMPEGLAAWVGAFVDKHHVEEPFVKRKRRPHHTDKKEDGIGDARVRQVADVYRAPKSLKGQGS